MSKFLVEVRTSVDKEHYTTKIDITASTHNEAYTRVDSKLKCNQLILSTQPARR